jgi:cell division septation protein DedD
MAGKGTRHRFELSRLEIAGVVVSGVAGLFVVFMLGIYAGRGMGDRRLDGGEQIVRLPVAPAVEQTPSGDDALTFYDTLGQDERMAARGGDKEGAERQAPSPPQGEPPTVEPERVAKAVEPPAAKPEPAKPEKDVVAKPEATAARRASAPTPSPAAAKAERATPTARVAVALAPTTATAPTPRPATRGDWSVQVSATRDPRTADAVLRRLRGKGYDAFVLKVRRRGETFYRVRVGHYASLDEAQQVVSRLRREPGVPEAFVASD